MEADVTDARPVLPKRKRMGVSPTRRSLAWLKSHGWIAEVVEQRLPIPGKFVTRDLFNCIDVVAVRPPGARYDECNGAELLGVQVTASAVTARMNKSEQQAPLRDWLAAGARFEVHGWVKRKIAPQPGVKRTTEGAFEYRLRRVAARLSATGISWHEVAEAGAREVGTP